MRRPLNQLEILVKVKNLYCVICNQSFHSGLYHNKLSKGNVLLSALNPTSELKNIHSCRVMALNWETFKSALGPFSETPVIYIDDEGSEIPIDCECEFQEALRLAKLSKNCLKLILFHKTKSDETIRMCHCEPVQLIYNPPEKCLEFKNKNVSSVSCSCICKENTCPTHGDVTPEWFTRYMKKFKKELLHELKSYVHDTVHSAVQKEKNTSHTESENVESFCEKNGISINSVATQSKKNKKILERNFLEVTDQRVGELHTNLFTPERLEMLDQKTKLLLEKIRPLESKLQCKTKCFGASDKKTTLKKSASFLRSSIYVGLQCPKSRKFNVTVYVVNDGNVRWSAPQLECFELTGLFPNDNKISLPRLRPMEKYFTVLTGRVSETPGVHHFKCRVMDGLKRLGPDLTCWTKVESLDSPEKFPNDSVRQKDVPTQLIDFENDVISSTQKKIEENINEIERRLHDIDLLQPSIYVETIPEEAKQTGKKTDEFQTDCDLKKDFEEKDRPVQRETQCENNCLGTDTPSRMCNSKIDSEKGKNDNNVNLREMKKDEENGSSDSEFSIILISEEEDNFLVVPSESFSQTESANEDKNSLNGECSSKPTAPTENAESVPAKQETKDENQERTEQGEYASNEIFRQSQFSPTRSRCSSFGEEISKPKKMKSKSTEYCFTTANLTQPTFTHIPGFFEGRPLRFTFTGEKEEKSTKCDPLKGTFVPRTDALGRNIYAVNSRGCCWPVKDVLEGRAPENSSSKKGTDQGIQNPSERRNERQNEIPPANLLPNVLNGASNMASFAFNTAKSVINNLQSAFATEVKAELGQPACEENVKFSMEALFKLYEMGFLDFQTNKQLLVLHNNYLPVVVSELVRMSENPSKESQ